MIDRVLRVLIVEDDYLIADDLSRGFKDAGIEIVGPVPSLTKALAHVDDGRLDGAVLDVNLDGEKVYEVADALIGHAVPVVFVTGYDRDSIPQRYADVPLCLKPIDTRKIVEVLRRLSAR